MVIRNEALRQSGGSALTDSSIAVPRAAGEFEGRAPEAAGEGARSGNDSCEVGSGPGEGAGAYRDSKSDLGSGGSRGPSTRSQRAQNPGALDLAQDDSSNNVGAKAGEGARATCGV